MTSRIQTQRFAATNTQPVNGTRPPGEFYVNFPDLRLGMIDPSQAAVDLLGVRRYVATASYAAGDYVTYAGQLQRAKSALTPHAYNATDWDPIPTQGFTDSVYLKQAQTDARYVQLTGSTMTGPLVLSGTPTLSGQAVSKGYVDGQVATRLPLAGGTMTGPLTLAGDPMQPLQPVTKQSLDSRIAGYLPLTGGSVTGTLHVTNGRFLCQSAGGGPSVTCWDTSAAYAAGMWASTNPLALNFGGMDGNGVPVAYYGGFDNSGGFHVSQNLWVGNDIHAPNVYVDGPLGVYYGHFSPHWFAFGWNGNINCYVDGGYQFDIASTNWVTSNFATYSWSNGTFLPLTGGHISGNIGVDGTAGFNNNVEVSGTFGVNGAANFYNTLSVSGSLNAGAVNAGSVSTQDGNGVHYAGITGETIGFYTTGSGMVARTNTRGDMGWGTTPSDIRLKRGIAVAGDALADLKRFTVHSFDMMATGPEGQVTDRVSRHFRFGLIADELEEHAPDCVLDFDGQTWKSLDLPAIVARCVKAIQQLAERINP